MNSEITRHAPCCCVFRWAGRIGAVLLFGTWLFVFFAEDVAPESRFPTSVYPQGISMAIIFVGYAIGWKLERVGGIISLLGVLAFYVTHFATNGGLPLPAFLLFAAPGTLLLTSWWLDKHEPADCGVVQNKNMRPVAT